LKTDDLLIMAWRMVFRNRRRYRAVIAAIALGTIGFIVIRTVGESVERRLAGNLELLGEAQVLMAEWKERPGSPHPGKYDMQDVVNLRKLPHVIAAAPIMSQPNLTAYFHRNETGCTFSGVDEQFWSTQALKLLAGRLITAQDVAARKRVCVIGKDIYTNLFSGADPVGQVIRVQNLTFRVIGILGGPQQDDVRKSVFVPIDTAEGIFPGLDSIKRIVLRVNTWDNVETARDQALAILKAGRERYGEGIHISYRPSVLARVKAVFYIVNFFIYSSLVVVFIIGKVGLTNVMLAAIQDRTREIGLRKAVGANDETIRGQFMLESVLISVFSGIIGVFTGVFCVLILKHILEVEISSYVMSASIVLDLVVTTLIGIAAGLYPSAQASRLDIVTAMRFE